MRQTLTFTFLLFLVHSTYGQQYLFARYTPKDGLINARTRFFYQDSRGRLYISTYGGLSVYDGSRFINYTTDNGLITSLVNDIVEMGDDSLWVVPNGPAIHCLVHGVLKDIHTADNFYPVINQLIRCSDGYCYAIADQGLFRYEHNRFVHLPLQDGQGRPVSRFINQAIESNGQLLILTDPYLGAWPGPGALLLYHLKTHRVSVSEKDQFFRHMVRTPDGDILVATPSGVRRIDPEALQQGSIHLLHLSAPYKAADDLDSHFLYFDNHNSLWLTTDGGLLKLDTTGAQQVFTATNGLPAGLITTLLQDREDNMWFANDRNGIVKLPNRQIASYPHPLPGFTVNDLCTSGDSDSVWLYDNSQHTLLLMQDNYRQLFRPAGPIPGNGRFYIGPTSYMVAGNSLYALHFLRDHRFSLSLIFRDSTFQQGSGLFDKRGDLILVSDKIMVIPSGRTTPIHRPRQYPLPYLCDQAALDSRGRVWAITRSNQLLVFNITPTDTAAPLHLLATYSKGLPGGSARSIAVDTTGRVWMGTRDHGLYCLSFDDLRFMSWKHLTTANGLSENFISYLQCDNDNTVWACTPAGLDRIRFENGRFTIDDLTHSYDNYQGVYKIQSTRKEVHWALVVEGLMKIGPSPRKSREYHPHILLSEIRADNSPAPIPDRKTLSLPYDHNTIAFHVGATSFIDETQTRYSYLLEGSSNPDWSPPADEATIRFINLPPGKYTLRVKARFLAGDYPDLAADYPFVILPPWWQTWWFRTAALASLAALAFLSIRIYIHRRLLRQRLDLESQQAIEKERTRIATDMHDELGAGLSRIKFLSETIGIKKQQQLPIEEEITGIRRYSHEMIDKMGEIVWALNQRNDSLSDLLSYTRSYAAEYLLQAGIECQVEAPPEIPSCFVSGEFRRNVYLTIKEALHNIVKHAQAEQVCIRTIVHPDKLLLITIEDDGIGFDRDTIRPFANGLNNMQRRIGSLGGSLHIHGGSGTTIRISVPL